MTAAARLPGRVSAALTAIAWLAARAHGQPIVADHTVVADYTHIPQVYIDAVKQMWVDVPGESHSFGYRRGCELLEAQDARFQVNVRDSGTPDGPTSAYLRISRATWGTVSSASGWNYNYGEEDWYTSATAISRTKAHLSYAWTHGLPIAAMGFGWCWDMTWHNNPGGGIDPVHKTRWAGSSVGGPQGDLRWGLDAADSALTSNSVCMDTYINATRQYMAYCAASSITTRVFFTTGPVDGGGNTGENGYQRHVKHQYLRAAATSQVNDVLFDYADILCWGNNGVMETRSWTDSFGTPHVFPYIHPDNMLDLSGSYAEDGDHIGERGAVRLAKAMWWMLARLAGWDGVPRTSQGVPMAWLASHGLVTNGYENAAAGDTDGDGMDAWQEFFAHTNPTNRASVLRILSVRGDGCIQWQGGTGAALPTCEVQRAVGSAPTGWTFMARQSMSANGSNVCTDLAMPAGTSIFYRILVPR